MRRNVVAGSALSYRARMGIRAGIVTVSDKGSRGERADTSGPVLRQLLEGIGAVVSRYEVVPDERERIAQLLVAWCDSGELDLVLTTGGTGLAARDVTPEATLDAAERLAPGLVEAMRAEGVRHTPMAMLSRAVAAVRARTLIVNLPGSEKGARESLGAIIDVLPHAIQLLQGTTEHAPAPEG